MNELQIIGMIVAETGRVINRETGVDHETNGHWSDVYPRAAMEVTERETTQWPHFTYTEERGIYFNLIYQDGYMQIVPSLSGLKRLLEWLYADTQRLPHTLDKIFQRFLSLDEVKIIDAEEKAKVGIMGSSPVLHLRHNYWLFTSDSYLSVAQQLMQNWYIEGTCVHKEYELNEDNLHLFL